MWEMSEKPRGSTEEMEQFSTWIAEVWYSACWICYPSQLLYGTLIWNSASRTFFLKIFWRNDVSLQYYPFFVVKMHDWNVTWLCGWGYVAEIEPPKAVRFLRKFQLAHHLSEMRTSQQINFYSSILFMFFCLCCTNLLLNQKFFCLLFKFRYLSWKILPIFFFFF